MSLMRTTCSRSACDDDGHPVQRTVHDMSGGEVIAAIDRLDTYCGARKSGAAAAGRGAKTLRTQLSRLPASLRHACSPAKSGDDGKRRCRWLATSILCGSASWCSRL
jgi:hypothetical protein